MTLSTCHLCVAAALVLSVTPGPSALMRVSSAVNEEALGGFENWPVVQAGSSPCGLAFEIEVVFEQL